MSAPQASHGPPSWFERNGNRIFWGLAVVCLLLVLADLLYHKHGHFHFEHWLGFHGLYGYVVFVVIVFAGKALRKLVMRAEDYYDG